MLSERQQDAVITRGELLMTYGPELPYPYASDVRGSRHGVIRELRAQSASGASSRVCQGKKNSNSGTNALRTCAPKGESVKKRYLA